MPGDFPRNNWVGYTIAQTMKGLIRLLLKFDNCTDPARISGAVFRARGKSQSSQLYMLDDDTTLAGLRARFPHSGRVAWIGLRPARRFESWIQYNSPPTPVSKGITVQHTAAASARLPSSSRNISTPSPRWRGSTPSIPRCCAATCRLRHQSRGAQGPLFSSRRGRARRHGSASPVRACRKPGGGRLQRHARSRRHHGPGSAEWTGAHRRFRTVLPVQRE